MFANILPKYPETMFLGPCRFFRRADVCNIVVDYPLLGFLTLGLAFKAPRGGSLGHMTPPTYCCSSDISSVKQELGVTRN